MEEDRNNEIIDDNGAAESGKLLFINCHDELVSFLIDILKLDENLDSEEDLLKNESYRILYSLLEPMSGFTAAVEEKYVDRVYRDSFYMHYSCKHVQYSRYCKRLLLFEGNILEEADSETFEFPDLDTDKLQKKFIGAVVIRPLREGKIGRTLINPYFAASRSSTYLRYAEYTVTAFGVGFRVNAFPFSMQDGETTTCAEITILNMLDYFSKRYPEYKYILPSEIAQITTKNGYERNLPTRGLGYSVITKVFSEAGFYPRLYNTETFMEMSQFKRIMHYYIESGIPVAVGVKVDDKTRHSIICMGHGKIHYEKIEKKIYAIYDGVVDDYIWLIDSADLCSDYIVMDDGQVPYSEYEWKTSEQENFLPHKHTFGEYEPDTLMVPLYRRMFLEAQDAYTICTSALASSKLGIRRFYPELGTKHNPIIIRLFMASARGFKQKRIVNFTKNNEEVRERYLNVLFPRFVWACEIYTKESYCINEAIGEIVVDATASPYDALNSILILHYPYQIMARTQNADGSDIDTESGSLEELFDKVSLWEEFDGYDNNLFLPRKFW